MGFDIDRDVFGEDFVDEEAATAYEDELLDIFSASPEARELGEGGQPSFWVRELIHLGIYHLGVTPARMSEIECAEMAPTSSSSFRPCAISIVRLAGMV
jgi:hypothetical protein